jgi:hypothetical protein
VWDVKALLWTYYIRIPHDMPIKNQTAYLLRMLKALSKKIIALEKNSYARPVTVNVTFMKRKRRITKFMFGTSMKCGKKDGMSREDLHQVNLDANQSRIKTMTIFQWNWASALTEKELESCKQPWGNCSELIPWENLNGVSKIAPLYTHTIKVTNQMVKPPCIKCKKVADFINQNHKSSIIPV